MKKEFLYLIGVVALIACLGFFANQKTFGQQVIPKGKDITAVGIANKYNQATEIKKKYKLQNAALIKEAKTEQDVRVEIGEKTKDEFLPEATFSKWNDEVHFKLKYIPKTKNNDVAFDKEKIIYQDGDDEIHFYDLGEDFEIEFVLANKPTSNKFEFVIENKGVEFYKQLPLDVEMSSSTCTATDCGGSHRPENVVNSYAVYHASQSNNKYMTGKVGHIYRIKATDDNGKDEWGDMDIKGDKLVITVPQKFIDDAKYPVKVDPTFGYGSIGGSYDGDTYSLKGSKFTLSENGDVSKLTVVVYSEYGLEAKGVIYDSSYNLKATTSEINTDNAESDNWHDMAFPSSLYLTSGVYWLTYFSTFPDADYPKYDSGDTNQGQASNPIYNGAPDPMNPTLNNKKYSIYATYTASSSETTQSADSGFFMFD